MIRKELINAGLDFCKDWYYLDVLLWAREWNAKAALDSKDYKLTSLKEALKIEIEGDAHRADADTIVMGHVVPQLLSLGPPEKTNLEAVIAKPTGYCGRFEHMNREGWMGPSCAIVSCWVSASEIAFINLSSSVFCCHTV